MRTLFANLAMMLFVGTALFAQNDEPILKAKQAVQEAALAGDAAKIKSARDLAQTAVSQSGTAPAATKAVALYYLGYASYSLVNMPSEKESKEQNIDAGVQALEEAIKLDPTFADAHGLLGSLYGQKAGGGMMAGMKYGQKSSSTMERASLLAPNNPRIMMFQGISLYFTPAMWGGDKQKAITKLQRACELAEQGGCASKAAIMPDWGHADVFAWKGVMFSASEDNDNAKAAYDRALQIAPDYAWVKHVLLPKLSANAR